MQIEMATCTLSDIRSELKDLYSRFRESPLLLVTTLKAGDQLELVHARS